MRNSVRMFLGERWKIEFVVGNSFYVMCHAVIMFIYLAGPTIIMIFCMYFLSSAKIVR